MLVRLEHIASVIVNANHCMMWAAVELRVAYCIAHRIRFAIQEPTEHQRIAY